MGPWAGCAGARCGPARPLVATGGGDYGRRPAPTRYAWSQNVGRRARFLRNESFRLVARASPDRRSLARRPTGLSRTGARPTGDVPRLHDRISRASAGTVLLRPFRSRRDHMADRPQRPPAGCSVLFEPAQKRLELRRDSKPSGARKRSAKPSQPFSRLEWPHVTTTMALTVEPPRESPDQTSKAVPMRGYEAHPSSARSKGEPAKTPETPVLPAFPILCNNRVPRRRS
jgi:hypothetical protein